MSKHKRYRDRLSAAGKCPHCGKEAAPYFECASRRLYKNIQRFLKRAARQGAMERVEKGWRLTSKEYVGKHIDMSTDRRCFPRVGGKPFSEKQQVAAYLSIIQATGRPMNTEEIAAKFVAFRRKAA